MPICVAINSYGCIDRNMLRVLCEPGKHQQVKIVVSDDRGDSRDNAQLTELDSVHDYFDFPVSASPDAMDVAGDIIRILSEPDPHALPWAELDIDIVYECTGHLTTW